MYSLCLPLRPSSFALSNNIYCLQCIVSLCNISPEYFYVSCAKVFQRSIQIRSVRQYWQYLQCIVPVCSNCTLLSLCALNIKLHSPLLSVSIILCWGCIGGCAMCIILFGLCIILLSVFMAIFGFTCMCHPCIIFLCVCKVQGSWEGLWAYLGLSARVG